ncbi:MAG TPA: histidinol dehydrogenase, partial [Anaerovibrio sp.]|nr:histidinol dehydrogenase [Anaerovibrio sp.]
MQIVNVKDTGLVNVEKMLKKPAFDQVELNPKIREANKQLFGRDMTAAEIVDMIVNEVRADGDRAVIKYTKLIDRTEFTAKEFLVTEDEYDAAYKAADPDIVESLKRAAANVRQYHQEQKPNSWMTYRGQGSLLGQSVIPLDRVGIYVPGGTAAYPSSVIMNAVPAAVAGVGEIIMMVPPKEGKINPYVLVAAKEAGVSKIFKIGGAQAIAAMAFGTETIPRVDKITGPGNIFVTLAKKAVYGHCDIDMLAGPSEILIVADETADPAYTAADMLSQAEHDMLASSIVITDSRTLAEKVSAEAEKQLQQLPRQEIARASLDKNGLIIVAE